ncbi:telomere-associated protein Tap [Streptomyces niveus]|uniref:Transcriptional regulator n=1 Tax=Streptomyces niveus TaxID=193462 RepID=A0A1U9R2A1_STRNV|nr:helix-turn-helix domain-containing protein [Streptomyces niveus]AQU70353.1 transcriptional regulator [Streptomyces niveus]
MPKKPDPVDALLKSGPRRTHLPEPAERARLRGDYGLTQAEVAAALEVTRATVAGWESGRSEPQGATRAAYAKLLEGIAAQLAPAEPDSEPGQEPVRAPAPEPSEPTPAAAPPAAAPPAAASPAAASPTPEPATSAPSPPRPAVARQRPAPRNSAPRRPATATTAELPASDRQFASGPLAVLDGDGNAYCVGGLVLNCPAKDIPALVEWALNDAGLGAPRLDRNGRDSDPLIVLTESAALRLGLPAELEDRRGLRLPDDHKVNKQVAKAKWTLTKRGFGPWARIYRPAREGRRQCVQLAVLAWDALDQRGWPGAVTLPPAELAHVLGTYAARVITPCGSTAVSGLELMTALRPPTRPVKDAATGTWASGPVPGSLTRAVDPAPPEAPDEHPVVAALHPRGHWRTPDEVIDEEAHDWIRDPQLLTDAECARKYAVGIDVNTAFLAAANRLPVGLGEPVHLTAPEFDKALPGSWLIDLSGIEMDPRLPSPFTPRGSRPTGPAWYATPTVAYAHELVAGYGLPVTLRPLEAWVRPEHGPYLDPWYKRLADAYRTTMAELGVTTDLDEHAFLAAMEDHKRSDPGSAAVLAAIKSTVKGGIGKLRERPQGAAYRPGERWPALKRPTWRPDIRAAVIATARVNMHRKLLRTAAATQSAPPPAGRLYFDDDALLPIALLSDGVVFLSDSPSPLDLLPRTTDGRPAPGAFRLGVSPGMVKHEGTKPLLWAAQLLDEGLNPARHIKDGVDAVAEGE